MLQSPAASMVVPFLKDQAGVSRGAVRVPRQDSVVPCVPTWPFAILSPAASLVEGRPGVKSCWETSVLFEVSKETSSWESDV